jgi:hypothetical protein
LTSPKVQLSTKYPAKPISSKFQLWLLESGGTSKFQELIPIFVISTKLNKKIAVRFHLESGLQQNDSASRLDFTSNPVTHVCKGISNELYVS